MLKYNTNLIAISLILLFFANNPWFGKTFVTFGDSITWYDSNTYYNNHIEYNEIAKGYQSYMRAELKCNVLNEGLNGGTMPDIWSEKISSYDFINIDAVTITSGANDYKNNVPLGSLANIAGQFDTTTFYGALQTSIEYIKNQNPEIKIYLITPIKGWYKEEGTKSVPNASAKGLLNKDYVNAIKEVGNLYDIPVCDWFDGTGFDETNKIIYYGDIDSSPYSLHPTNEGYKRMTEILIPFLKNN